MFRMCRLQILCLFMTAVLQAAPITWGPPIAVGTGTGNSSDVSTNGTLVEAYNAAITTYTGGNQTANGVTFVATTKLLPSNGSSTIDFSAATNGGDSAYDAILSTADFGGGQSTTITIGDGDGDSTVNGTGLLEVGKNYELQVWFVDDRTSTTPSAHYTQRTMGYAGSSSGTVVNLNDQHVIGTFTADASTQTLFLDTVSSAVGDSFGNTHITAYQIRRVSQGPIPTLSTVASSVTGPFTVNVLFSEAVQGLTLGDFQVSGGSGGSLAGSGASYSLTITPAALAGEVTVILPAGSVNGLGGDLQTNSVSNTLVTTVAIPEPPSVTLYGSFAASMPQVEIFLTFSEDVAGLEAADFQVTNGSVTSVQPAGRTRSLTSNIYIPSRNHFSALVTAAASGTVAITLPAGAVLSLDGNNETNLASNTLSVNFAVPSGDSWRVDDAAEWTGATAGSNNLNVAGGFAEPTANSSGFTSIIRTFPTKRKTSSLNFKQSPVWDNWIPLGYDIRNSIGTDAPVLIPAGPDNYYILALKDNIYQAWHSTDMVNWTLKGPVVSGAQGRWVTSAEYKDGQFYIYSDHFNDHTSHVFRDNNLGDGIAGTYLGPVLARSGSGSDLAAFRDNADGLFHLIYEDWSPIKARDHAWDSPLAGHTSSPDGINGFLGGEHRAPVDHRTNPTGTFGSYDHPHVTFDPTYEIHIPEQDAYGDWTAIKIGEQYYLFGDYEPVGQTIRLARFTGKSIYGEFDLVGSTDTGGHPDPTVGFAEGKFYLITQKNSFYSPGPWVEGVEARAGVDGDGNGTIDTWTAWQTVREQYSHTPNFIRVVTLTPAGLDLAALPAGYGFQFEFRMDDTVVTGVSPIMDRVEMSFLPANFDQWAIQNSTVVEANGDHNQNGVPNLVEFALGQSMLPARQPDGTLTLRASQLALADGYTIGLRFSGDLKTWTTATSATPEVRLLRRTTLGNGDQELVFDIPSTSGKIFWQIVVL